MIQSELTYLNCTKVAGTPKTELQSRFNLARKPQVNIFSPGNNPTKRRQVRFLDLTGTKLISFSD
jgi:hypothetical protein